VTTIAWDGQTLAADAQATHGDRITGHVVKVHRLGNGGLVAVLGFSPGAHQLLDWLKAGKPGEQPSAEGALIHITPQREFVVYEGGGSEPSPEAPFKAWGSGAALAIGAMAAGATAEEAVLIASHYDIYTSGEITALRL
jgi:ATP-dependent protease HslVU (ClpYQ) peptidase subunit